MPNLMRPNNMGGKEKFDLKAFNKIIIYCKPYMFSIVVSIVCAIVGAITTIIGPDKIGDLMNEITKGILLGVDMPAFIHIAVSLIIIYSVGAIFNYAQQFIMAIVTQKTSQNLRSDIDKKINKLPLSYFDRTTKGDILSRVTNDVDTISQTLGSSIANLVSAVVLFVGVIIMMFTTNWLLALVTIGSSSLGFVAMALILKNSQKYFNKTQVYLGDINGHIEEVYTNFEIVKSYNATNYEKQKLDTINNKMYQVTWKGQFISGLMPSIMGFVGDLSYVLIFVVGVSIIINGGSAVTLGTLMSFIIYARLFSQPLRTFAQSMSSIQQASAASRRVFEMLEQKEVKDESKKDNALLANNVVGNVEFRNVRFGYTPKKVIIKNFSASLSAGQKVAIVGPTGAGKTTLVNLLMRFYEIRAPRLIINGEISKYKVFNNGKSSKIVINNIGELYVNNNKTEYVLENVNLPIDVELKFDKDFNLITKERIIDDKIEVVKGENLLDVSKYKFAIAYYGDIFIDGVPIKSLTRECIHDMFDMILQDTWLFNGTIKENLIYNTNNVEETRLKEVCDAVGLTHFINSLPNGFDTILKDVNSLSEGQKQQLTIARAMIKDSPLLILDEATSSVDTRTELVIQQAMDELTKGRTSFVIAHRLSTIKNADIILVLKDGDIIEMGNHNELLSKGGFYAELYNSQFVKTHE